jgi:uncharacterized protein YjbI with pentapeptide repeats
MSNPTTQGHQLVRFEEVTPTNEIVAFFAGRLKPLITGLGLPIYDGYDGLDEIQFVFLTLPSGQTVTLGQYANSPQVGVDLYVDNTLQDVPTVTFEACKYLGIPRQEVIWFHPDWQDEIDRLYAEHGSIEKRPESAKVEELSIEYEPIDCFKHALRVYTKRKKPQYWAMLQHNLGLAYFNRIQGDLRSNLRISIECFKKSLEIYTQEKFPDKWDMNQRDLKKSQQSLDSFKLIQKQRLIQDIIGRQILDRQLKGANLIGAKLTGVKLIRANLCNAKLGGVDMSHANLGGANLSNAKLGGANLSSANMSCANMSGSNLNGADLIDADLIDANLSYADLSKASLSGANLNKADLSAANLSSTNLSSSNLNQTVLSGSNLVDADLANATLIGADLSRAKLTGANLTGANLHGANVKNARFKFNSGISEAMKQDLIARGAIFEDTPRDQSKSRNLAPR